MKSKTRQTSQSTQPKRKTKKAEASARPRVVRLKAGAPLPDASPSRGVDSIRSTDSILAEALAIGHAPSEELSPRDAELFRAFQSNLLSLISHELRTPLMGVLNALTLLHEGTAGPEISITEMIAMARQNAQRLHRALVTLLDLAALDSGTFHARLREVELIRLVKNRVGLHQKELGQAGVELKSSALESASEFPVLGDAQKLSRGIDLCLEIAAARAARGSELVVRVAEHGIHGIEFEFTLPSGAETAWDSAWSQGVAGFEGGVGSPNSAFAGSALMGTAFRGVLQSEQAFLSRAEEGLGSEFLLVHQIMRLHQGVFEAFRDGMRVRLALKFVALSSEEAVRAVLLSRAYEVSTELGSVAVALIRVPAGMDVDDLCHKVKASLFRATDAAYSLPERKRVALILDDCKAEDAPRLLQRLEKALGRKLEFGIAHCPQDVADPSLLLSLAEGRLKR